MTDTKTFRHIGDRQEWLPVFTEAPYVVCRNKTTNRDSYIYCDTHEQARAVSCVPELLQLVHEMLFCLEKDSRADYAKRVNDVLGYVYDL